MKGGEKKGRGKSKMGEKGERRRKEKGKVEGERKR